MGGEGRRGEERGTVVAYATEFIRLCPNPRCTPHSPPPPPPPPPTPFPVRLTFSPFSKVLGWKMTSYTMQRLFSVGMSNEHHTETHTHTHQTTASLKYSVTYCMPRPLLTDHTFETLVPQASLPSLPSLLSPLLPSPLSSPSPLYHPLPPPPLPSPSLPT